MLKLYGVNLPDIKKKNATKIIRTCRDIHQMWINGRKRNSKMQIWDKYWVNAYNLVLSVLKEGKK